MKNHVFVPLLTLALIPFAVGAGVPFDGRIAAALTFGGQSAALLYTAGTNCLRVENQKTDRPHAWNLFDRQTGALTLCYPHNRSFVRLPMQSAAPTPAGLPPMPVRIPAMPSTLPPPGLMPATPSGIGPTNLPGAPAMPPMPVEQLDLKATGETTNLLGYACARYEIRRGPEVMEIWATDQLLPFQPHLENQPRRVGPRMIEEQWGELLKAKKLFPVRAILKFENGPERLRFEVKAITPEKIEDRDGKLFQPPPDYQEIQPLPF